MRVNIFAKAKTAPKTKTLAAIGCAALSFVATACGADAESNTAADNKGELTVTDVAGRTVTFAKQPERVVLGEGRAMFVTAMLDQENPGDHVVAMGSDLHSGAPSFEAKLFETNPELKDMPTIGNIAKGDVTVENLISHDPDVVVMTLDHKKAAEESGFLTKLDQAGLKYVFTDFRQKPLENTAKSVELLGQIVDEQDNAKKFTDFYT
ncbi:ABC transporter substrate-binding protein, partial [Corynebacterium amycolatum]|nr:ABC transporter substrate-binding protein [Corynebacterium amycolatum]